MTKIEALFHDLKFDFQALAIRVEAALAWQAEHDERDKETQKAKNDRNVWLWRLVVGTLIGNILNWFAQGAFAVALILVTIIFNYGKVVVYIEQFVTLIKDK